MIGDALKQTGSYNPDDTMPIFEEGLTAEEYKMIHAFLSWCDKNHKTFGRANYEQVFAEWLDSPDEDWLERDNDRKIRRAEQGYAE